MSLVIILKHSRISTKLGLKTMGHMTVLSKSVPILETFLFPRVSSPEILQFLLADVKSEISASLSSTPPEASLNVMLTMGRCHTHPQINKRFLHCVLLSLPPCHLKARRLTLFDDFPV